MDGPGLGPRRGGTATGGWRRRVIRNSVSLSLLICVSAAYPQDPGGGSASHRNDADVTSIDEIETSLASGVPTEVLVLFDDTEVERDARDMRKRRKLRFDDAEVLGRKARLFARLKSRALRAMDAKSYKLLRNFSHLPIALVRLADQSALDRLRARPEVRAILPNRRKYLTLDSISAGLVGQPQAQALGSTGSGTTVLVVDAGVDFTQADFGPCTAPGVPAATCKVVYASNISGSGGGLDTSTSQHGTNVSGIVVGVAPGTKIASINVFGTTGSTTDSLILQAINWGIANQAAYDIRAINFSLGDASFNTAPCANPFLNPYVTALSNARATGILTVASAGNEGYTNAIANPACTPQVVSVGAVYSQNWGAVSGSCSDPTTAADQVSCFSNSASFLTLLAPGAFITAGGRQLAGTSQAAPFVSGAIAVLRAAYPGDTLDQTLAKITSGGVAVTDSRNGVTKPRLNLFDSVRPANDDFADRFVGSGSSGSATATNAYASKEASEPNHAGNSGGRSIWWKWVAPAAGQVALDTHGTGFDSLLAAYTGSAVSTLALVASNDNDGYANGASGLYFQAQSGVEYKFVVDGKNAASGSVSLAWQLNTAATANLRTSTSLDPSSITNGNLVTFRVTVVNDGPQPATGVQAIGALPSQLTFVSGDSNCPVAGANFSCMLGTILPGASASANLQLRAATSGSAQVSASATSQVTDPAPSNNISMATVAIQPAAQTIPLPSWAIGVLGLLLFHIATRDRFNGCQPSPANPQPRPRLSNRSGKRART